MDLGEELEKAKLEIFRFESLQEYFSDGSNKLGNEIQRQWKETGKIDMDLMKEWHNFIKKKTSTGVKFTWVRLVEFPLNEYTKSSIYIYKKRVTYGIDIRVITKEKFDSLKLTIQDFYMLDGKPLIMHYGKHNKYLGCQWELKDKIHYIHIQKMLLKNSIPIVDFNI